MRKEFLNPNLHSLAPMDAVAKPDGLSSLSRHSMELTLLKSKIHRAMVTGASLDYGGSLTISSDIAEMVGLLPYEKILVGNLQNGNRFETYVIYATPKNGVIELNGATAHLGKIGDLLTIMSFARASADKARSHRPRIAVLDRRNRVVRTESGETPGSRKQWEAEILQTSER